jgi:murein DD-endopeptidase MepM/ murein hydrolase activator NlpD
MKTIDMDQWSRIISEHTIFPIVSFDKAVDRLKLMNFTSTNAELTASILEDTALFSEYVNNALAADGAKYGIGGYNEHRTVYARSGVFDAKQEEEPRRIHLGVDIWGEVHSEIYCPLDGVVHSFAFNDHFGDYGATIILQHQIAGLLFYTLYGHLSLKDIAQLKEGEFIKGGDLLAHFGPPEENGYWPPHLHFQIIFDLEGKKGDYPGVCSIEKRPHYLSNCPDPSILLGFKWMGKVDC